MTDFPDRTESFAVPRWHRIRLGSLLCLHIVICCLSLVYVAEIYVGLQVFMFDKTGLYAATLNVAAFSAVSAVFAFSRFSFGYFVGFYLYTLILGYLWLAAFSKFHYDHTAAAASAFISAVAFLLPALLIRSPIKQRLVLSARSHDKLLSFIMILAAIIVAAGAFYNFRLVNVADIYSFRGDLEFPAWLRYGIGATSNALLPFAFACFVARGNRWRAAAALLLLVLFYPIMLTKLTLFAPLWLLFLALLVRLFEVRTAALLSLLVPASIGVVLATLLKAGALPQWLIIDYFGAVNFRMLAMPSVALDLYNDYFSTRSNTHFCQILFLKPLLGCPYGEPLSVLMSKAYGLGNVNASLFATEGIASVGPVLAPLAALACGLVIALGNRLSSGLPGTFILLSGGILVQAFLNIPLTTNLLSNGAAILFLLWYLTPRTMFDPKAVAPAAN